MVVIAVCCLRVIVAVPHALRQHGVAFSARHERKGALRASMTFVSMYTIISVLAVFCRGLVIRFHRGLVIRSISICSCKVGRLGRPVLCIGLVSVYVCFWYFELCDRAELWLLLQATRYQVVHSLTLKRCAPRMVAEVLPAVGTNTCTKQEQYGTEREGYDTTMSLNVPARSKQ